MRIVIAGASALGVEAARQFIEAGHDVVIVDRDRDLLDRLADRLDCGFIQGDATLPSILREAAGESPDVLLAVTDADQANVLCALVGSSIGFARVVPQVSETELTRVCDELGLDDMIAPHATVAASLVDMVEDRDDTEHDVHLTGELRLMRFAVSKDLDGQGVGDLSLGGRGRAVAVRRGEEDILIDGELTLREEDELLVVVKRREADAVAEVFKPGETS